MLEVHVRHGQATAESGWNLTSQGEEESLAARDYLTTHFPDGFEVGFHSPSRRAAQTARLPGCEGLSWQVDSRLQEVDYSKGEPNDKSWDKLLSRVTEFYGEIDAKYPDKNRIFVSHGGTLRMTRMYREGLARERFGELFQEPYKFFTNCQIIIYTDKHPENGKIGESRWVKSVCPWGGGRFGHDWMQVGT